MVLNTRQLFEAAAALPETERAELIERLLETLDPEHREEIDRLWAQEAERRLSELDNGQVSAVPGDLVMRRLRDGIPP